MLLESSVGVTNRCFLDHGGTFTECIHSGLGDDTVIDGGVVDLQKRWLTFPRSSVEFEAFVSTHVTICGINH